MKGPTCRHCGEPIGRGTFIQWVHAGKREGMVYCIIDDVKKAEPAELVAIVSNEMEASLERV